MNRLLRSGTRHGGTRHGRHPTQPGRSRFIGDPRDSAARPRKYQGEAGFCCPVNKLNKIIETAPTLIAESATLNTGNG